MKFMHIADVHLGADPDAGRLKEIDRGQEIWDTWEKTIRKAEDEQVDLILIAGDLFHQQPLVRELKEVNYLLSEVYHGKTVLIAGNHDYLKRDSNYLNFPWDDRITVLVGGENGVLLDKIFYPEWNLEVYGFSFQSRELTKPLYEDVNPENNDRMHILLAHGGDAKHIPITSRTFAMSGFDYIALGHIHKPEVLIPDRAAFAGSLEPTDHNDLGEHGMILGELSQTENGKVQCQTSFIPMASRSYFHETVSVTEETTTGSLRDHMQEVMQKKGPDNLYKWELNGFRHPEMQFDCAQLASLGNSISVTDQTKPAYHMEKLAKAHEDDIVGLFIQSFLSQEDSGELEKQALYAGVEAMLEVAR